MDASIIYGLNPVLEALAAGVPIQALYVAGSISGAARHRIEQAARDRGVRLLRTDTRELDRLSEGGVHQGVLAQVAPTQRLELAQLMARTGTPRTLLLCLDEVQDPRNLGALARSALAFGATGIVVPGRRSSPVTPAAIKASAGALCRLPVATVTNLGQALDRLKQGGFWIAGAVAEDARPPWEIDPGDRVAVVLGSEGRGLRKHIEERLDFRAWIPMRPESESFNVSVAGAILLYEWLGRVRG